jgi:Spy/CpxP family protein refolding chaperone
MAFNVCFAAGYFQAKAHIELTKTPEGRAELFLRRLNLDEAQATAVRQLRDEYFAEWRRSMETKRAEYETFWTEIVKEEPDEQVLQDFIQSASSVESRSRFVRYMRNFMRLLRPEQRLQVVEQIRRRYRDNKKEEKQSQAPGSAPGGRETDAPEEERRES